MQPSRRRWSNCSDQCSDTLIQPLTITGLAWARVAPDTVMPASLPVRCPLSTYKYAAYGSNLHPTRLQKRVSSAKLLGTSTLPGYDLRFNKAGRKDGSGKCTLVSGYSEVHLAIYEVREAERPFLDHAEGLGCGYDHLSLNVDGFGHCSTYIAASNAINDDLQPFDWYKEMVLLGCVFNGFPSAYTGSVKRVSAVKDTNSARSSSMWSLVRKLHKGS